MPANQGSSRQAQMRGDMMLASTRPYISSGKMNTSMSDSVTADDLRSRARAESAGGVAAGPLTGPP